MPAFTLITAAAASTAGGGNDESFSVVPVLKQRLISDLPEADIVR